MSKIKRITKILTNKWSVGTLILSVIFGQIIGQGTLALWLSYIIFDRIFAKKLTGNWLGLTEDLNDGE